MTPPQLFAVGVRLIGLLILLDLLQNAFLAFSGGWPVLLLVRYLLGLALGSWMLLGASALVSLAYGGRSGPAQ